ncbi:hypothetical protein AgCh_017190 [Apium graveolens]
MATGRVSFAKLLIEVEATRKLPENLFVLIPNENGGKEVEVYLKVEYPWRPPWCSHCLKFGYSLHVCPVVAANKMQENKLKESVPRWGLNSFIPKDEFQVVQRRGKEKVVDNNRGNQKSNKGGVGDKNQFRYINKCVVIRENQDQGFKFGSLKAVNYRDVNNRSQGKIGVQNKFDILDIENVEEVSSEAQFARKSPVQILQRADSLNAVEGGKNNKLARVEPDNAMVVGEFTEDRQLGGGLLGEVRRDSVMKILNKKVTDYVCSGSLLSKDEVVFMEHIIDKREKE